MGNRQAAVQLYNQAVITCNDKTHPSNLSTAYSQFVSACYADPTWSTSFYQCGCNSHDLNHRYGAIACYRRALENKPEKDEKAKILCNLALTLHEVGETDEALTAIEESLRLDPSLSIAWMDRSLIIGTLNKTDLAVEYAQRAYDLSMKEKQAAEPDNPNPKCDSTIEMCLAFQCLFDRQLAKGFGHFESRFAYKLHSFLHYPYPRWEGQDGGTVFLVADQGLGDTLSFARFVHLTCKKARFVHACVQPELMKVFAEAFVGIDNLNLMPSPSPFPPADYWTTFVSLPFALGLNDQEIRNTPHISFRPYGIPSSWKVPDREFHIGIQWSGSALNEINKHRSIPLEMFYEFCRVPGVQLYSLQMDDARKELGDRGALPVVHDLSGYIRDVSDTIAILQHLDLVICCESALAHIAALAGKECWIPYSFFGHDYRIGHTGRDMIWTPKHRIFSQRKYERDWKLTFDRIVSALRERVGGTPEWIIENLKKPASWHNKGKVLGTQFRR